MCLLQGIRYHIKLAQTFHQNGTNNPSFRVRGGHTSYYWVLTITHNKNVTVRQNVIPTLTRFHYVIYKKNCAMYAYFSLSYTHHTRRVLD